MITSLLLAEGLAQLGCGIGAGIVSDDSDCCLR